VALCRSLLPALALAAVLTAPLRALAEPPPPAPTADVDDDDDEAGPEAGARRPAASDMRTGNLFLGGKVAVTAPGGKLGPSPPNTLNTSRATADITSTGVSFGGLLGVGLGRHASLQVEGEYSRFGAPTGCTSGCKGQSYDLGLGFAYHLAQGVAVDPWASFGMGYRAATFITNVDLSGAAAGVLNEQRYRGFDFARIALGADFYPAPVFGFGPYFEVDVGASLSPAVANVSPPPTGTAFYAFVHFGLRVTLDPFRRAGSSSRPRSAMGALPPNPRANQARR
jgi:hypothetical protein